MEAAINRRHWAERSGEFSPTYYAHLGPNEVSRHLVELLDEHVERDAAILELGCSAGRHLAHLHDNGFTNLHGIDINDRSFEVMAEYFPSLAEHGSFEAAAIERFVPQRADREFDVVYSVQTLQHVHEDDAWVFAELARITGQLLVTVENEGDGEGGVKYVDDELPLYYRNWAEIFTNLGFVERATERRTYDTTRVFERSSQ